MADHHPALPHIQRLARADGYLEIRILERAVDDKGKDYMIPRGSRYIHVNGALHNVDPSLQWADEQHRRGREVFIAPNPRREQGGKNKADVATLTWCYADLDLNGERIEQALEALRAAPCTPALVNHSGYGLHPLWAIEPSTDKAKWTQAQRAIQAYFAPFNADPSVSTDEARVLRLVPYPNRKHGQERPTATVFSSDAVYTLDQIIAALTPNAGTPVDTQRGVLPQRTRAYLERGASEGSRNKELYAAAQQYFAAGYPKHEAERDLLPRALQDGLGDTEARRAIESGYKSTYVTQPITARFAENERAITELLEDVPADALDALRSAPQTDTGNAECLIHLYRDLLRYNHTRRKWLHWTGTRWELDDLGLADRAAIETARVRRLLAAQHADSKTVERGVKWALQSENKGRRDAMLQTASVLDPFATREDDYDRDPWLAGLINGVLDLKTGTQRPADHADAITAQLGAAYDPAADCPRWLIFLSEVFGGDLPLMRYLQRAVGYSLTGDTREQKLFLCFGHGHNGKSVLLNVISALLGEYAATASFSTFDADRRNESTNDLAALKGKRLVTVIESDEDKRLAEARVKSVTGQDPITCRFLYGEFFTYIPNFKLWMAMNHKPTIANTDNGIWRRIHLIPFTQNFEQRADKTLTGKLLDELPGILNWALAGLAMWQREGLGSAPLIDAATAEYRTQSDLIGQWLEECTYQDADATTPVSQALSSLNQWCATYGYRPKTANALSRRMAELGYQRERIGVARKQSYIGLALIEQPKDTYERY